MFMTVIRPWIEPALRGRFRYALEGKKHILAINLLNNNLKKYIYYGTSLCRSVENQDGRTH